jgi:hypothetical protein
MATVKVIPGKTLYRLTIGPKEAAHIIGLTGKVCGNEPINQHIFDALYDAGVTESNITGFRKRAFGHVLPGSDPAVVSGVFLVRDPS